MKEEKRLEVIQRVFRGELTVVEAALVLGVSERQCYRIMGDPTAKFSRRKHPCATVLRFLIRTRTSIRRLKLWSPTPASDEVEIEIGFIRANHRFTNDFCSNYPHRLKSLVCGEQQSDRRIGGRNQNMGACAMVWRRLSAPG